MTSSDSTQILRQKLIARFHALRQHKAFLPVAACVGGGMLLTYLAMKRYYRRNKWKPRAADFEIMQLRPEETDMMIADEPPVCAISFFDCSESDLAAAEAWVTDRVGQIAAANRWIAGRLVHAPDTGVKSFAVPHSISKEDLDRLLLKHPENFCPARSMNLEQLYAECVKIQLPHNLSAYDKEDVLASRFVFARTPGGFCIVFFISHTVADGATFYNIVNQFSASGEVRALDPKRKMDFGEKVKDVVLGMDTQQAFMSVSAIVSMMKGMFFGGKVRGFTGFVDAEGVAQAKAAAKRRGVVPFVSTNDILTSAFSNAIGADVCLMLMNLRGRMAGLAANLAGNYEKCLLFDSANASSPDGIRLALRHPHFHCRDVPMPPLSQALSARYCLITNWVSFSKPIDIPGCVEQVHRPVYDFKYMWKIRPFDGAIVFRAGAGKLGVFWITQREGSPKDVFGDMPITDIVKEF